MANWHVTLDRASASGAPLWRSALLVASILSGSLGCAAIGELFRDPKDTVAPLTRPDSIYEALQRRETFGTSGPRIAVRFFGGWDYPGELCGQADLVAQGYEQGVPMGAVLPPATDARPGALVCMGPGPA